MYRKSIPWFYIVAFLVFIASQACNNTKRPPASEIAISPEELEKKVTELITGSLDYATQNDGKIDDSLQLQYPDAVKLIYGKKWNAAVWTEREQWRPLGDSMLRFIEQGKLFGLFPEDYHLASLNRIREEFAKDSLGTGARRDALNWAKADILLTDAFVHVVKDLKLGRLEPDSLTLREDSVLTDEFYFNRLAIIQKRNSLEQAFHALEPKHPGYYELKAAIPAFLDSADDRTFTKVPLPRERSPRFKELLQARLYEEGFLSSDTLPVDSTELASAVERFQRKKNIAVDGKVGEETVKTMNISDHDRFIRIAITLDRYKMLPGKMPDRYVWVNIPGYYMRFFENDTLRIQSRIICGKPTTRTPLLNSAISELITYPQWTVPQSIIAKEILPGIKRDSDYLARKGFSLIDSRGDEVDPHTVDWSKYRRAIPYRVVQGSGDENALGILKFNFPNKYAVYLHDTNQRYLFARTIRSLSHGCVRVQEWEKLALSIIRYDNRAYDKKRSPVEDSLNAWMARKEKHSIAVRNRLPLFIRYFTCEGDQGKVLFYDDIYNEDKAIMEKYFSKK